MDQENSKKTGASTGVLVGIIAVLVILIAVLSAILIKNGIDRKTETAAENTEAAEETVPEETVADTDEAAEETEETAPAVSYMKDEAFFTEENLSEVIATVGSVTLTNRDLAYAYWDFWYDMYNYYGYYMYYYMDPTASFDSQYISDEMTWDQYIMDYCLDNFTFYAVWYNAAQEAGYTLDGEYLTYVNELPYTLEEEAEEDGCESADAYIQSYYGPYTDAESYIAYQTMCVTGYGYYCSVAGAITFTDAEIEAYYDQNADELESSGIEKTDLENVNIRHILIMPEEVTLSSEDEGYDAAVEAANAAAKAKAEEIYQEWQSGVATESTFAEFAEQYSEDTGSNENGGLYEDVYPGEMVETFNDWCFDAARQPGDTGIVETDYGYHIMYFIGSTGEIYWRTTCLGELQAEAADEKYQELSNKFAAVLTKDNAGVYPCNVVSEE